MFDSSENPTTCSADSRAGWRTKSSRIGLIVGTILVVLNGFVGCACPWGYVIATGLFVLTALIAEGWIRILALLLIPCGVYFTISEFDYKRKEDELRRSRRRVIGTPPTPIQDRKR